MSFLRTRGSVLAWTAAVAVLVAGLTLPAASAQQETGPTVSQIDVGLDGGESDASYDTGDAILVDVEFSAPVTLTGSVRLGLDIGGTTKYATVAWARGDEVRFIYSVEDGDEDLDGFSLAANSLNLDAVGDLAAGTVSGSNGQAADLSHAAVSTSRLYRVNAPDAPTVDYFDEVSDSGGDEIYVAGDTIEVKAVFTVPVTVDTSDGSPTLAIEIGESTVAAAYSRSDGADVVFTYTVVDGDSAPKRIKIHHDGLSLNGASVTGANGQEAVIPGVYFTYAGSWVDAVSGVATVESISFTSNPGSGAKPVAAGDAYAAGETIEATATFSENVGVSVAGGSPTLTVTVGDGTRTFTYNRHSDAAVVFSYTVVVGDIDRDGVSVGADQISLGGGTIRSEEGIDADLSHVAVPADSGHMVSAPGGV